MCYSSTCLNEHAHFKLYVNLLQEVTQLQHLYITVFTEQSYSVMRKVIAELMISLSFFI